MSSEPNGVLANTAVMAAGTIFSRLSGFLRSALLAAALGLSVRADTFTIANTVPNMLYILLAGGVFNAVLVPQLVRAMKNDADGGEAYTNRVITAAGMFLLVVTALLVIAAPLVMSLMLSNEFDSAELAAQRASAIDLARYCLPQVFFYGMFVLVGQVLNARGKFGPMMWAPIANNVIAVATLVAYLVLYGPTGAGDRDAGLGTGQEVLLGVGSTIGIVAQLLILLPYLRAVGFTFKPRFDLRDAGLAHTLRLGVWTFGFVILNQIAYVVVVRLASSGPAESPDGTGITIYTGAFLVMMVPHSIITVSLATAVLPRMSRSAAAGEWSEMNSTLVYAARNALAVVVPFAALLPVLAPEISRVVWGYGAASVTYTQYIPTLSLFGLGLMFFTLHYLTLRGFYAMEQTRTVFFIQCAVAATNIVVAITLVTLTEPSFTAPALVIAYATAYAVGSMVSGTVLRRSTTGRGSTAQPHSTLQGSDPSTSHRRFAVRTVAAVAGTAAVALVCSILLREWFGPSVSQVLVAIQLLLVAGIAGIVYVVLARWLRLDEVNSIVSMVTRRIPGVGRR